MIKRGINNITHDKYDNEILKALKSIDMSLKNIAKNIQPANAMNNTANNLGKVEEMKDDN